MPQETPSPRRFPGHGKIDRQRQPEGMAARLTRQDTKLQRVLVPLLHNKATLTKKRINTNLVRHAFQTPPRFCCYPRALPRLIDLQPRSQCGASANPKGRGHCCSGPCRALCRHERFSPSHSITPKHNVPAWYMLLK